MAKPKKEIVREERDAGGSLVIEQDEEGNQAGRVVTHKEIDERVKITREEEDDA